MRSRGVMRGALAVLVGLSFLMPAVTAQGFDWYVPPKTENAETVQRLFNIILWIAIVVFVFVEGLLFYVVWRFRHNKVVPKGETHRGHTRAEIAWSVAPALILVFIGVLSVNALEQLDRVPDDTDFTVRVEAQQFAWLFTYPDDTTSINTMYVEEGSRVRMEITATDVIHAVWIPDFAMKVDAVPGRTNVQWFDAPGPGRYFIQCAEYCGVGHHAMHADIEVFPAGSRDQPFGAPPEVGGGVDDVPRDNEFTVELLESGGSGGGRPWSVAPPTLEVRRGQGVHVTSVNAGDAVHNLTFPAFGVTTPPQQAGEERVLAFVADRVGTFEYLCGIPGHKQLGMVGTITVTE